MKNSSAKKAGKKKSLVSFLCPLLLAIFLAFPIDSIGESKDDLIITEIMYDPEGTDSGHSDWLEIYNPGPDKINIDKNDFGIIDEKELEIGSDEVHYKNCHQLDRDLEIKPKSYAVVAQSDSDFLKDYPEMEKSALYDSAFSLSSSGDHLRLSSDDCETFFVEMEYESSWGGKNNGFTLEKEELDNKYKENDWQESYVPGGTPARANSQKPDAKDYDFEITINEIFPAPSEGKDEYIELLNSEEKTVDLFGWILKDGSAGGKYVFPEESEISKKDYLVVYKKDFGFSLNNSGDESVTFINPAGVEISRLDYRSSTKDFAYAFDGTNWRWTSKITPGEKNQFDKILSGKIEIEEEIYANVYASFSVKSDYDAQKFTWDFGDGHKSYLKEARHKYEKTGKYSGSLRIRGNGEEKIYNFTVEVKKFPQPKVRIVSISPNPKGKDTDKEYIVLENKTKKTINLKDWSIATGTKNLYNHPIREDFKIKKGKTKKLTRDICAFTLNNTKTKIELRAPDGKVIQSLKYDKKKEKMEEDEIYEKEDDGWEWVTTQNDTETDLRGLQSKTSEVTPAPKNASSNKDTVIQIDISSEELHASLGKYTPVGDWEKKIQTRNDLIGYGTTIKLANVNFTGQPLVLGAEIVKEYDNHYAFTPPIIQKHWAVKLTDDLWLMLNSGLNHFLYYFF